MTQPTTQAIEKAAEKAAGAVGVTPTSDMRPFVVQAVIHALSAAASEREQREARVKRLEAALVEAEEVLALVEHGSREDPHHAAEVRRLGERIGYGALMSSASASWRLKLEQSGQRGGCEFVSGPCAGTVRATLEIIRAALEIKP